MKKKQRYLSQSLCLGAVSITEACPRAVSITEACPGADSITEAYPAIFIRGRFHLRRGGGQKISSGVILDIKQGQLLIPC